jgi:ketosteroid isomerase-like protein
MGTNDFDSLTSVVSADFVLEWPQSKERIRGVDKFIRKNQESPAHGLWRFTINRLVGGDSEVTSDVSVTDGIQVARAISFFTVENDKISRIVEFWPESYVAPANRAHLVEVMD